MDAIGNRFSGYTVKTVIKLSKKSGNDWQPDAIIHHEYLWALLTTACGGQLKVLVQRLIV